MAVLVDAGVPAAQAAEAAFSEAESGTVVGPPEPAAAEIHALALAIADAAERYDEPALLLAIHEAVDTLHWRGALAEVLFPSLRLIGERWTRGELGLSAEHFASSIVRRELLAAVAALAPPPAVAPAIVLACPEDEWHDLGINALWLLLREADLRVIFLGTDVPSVELLSALRRSDADAVSLSATAPTALPIMGLTARALVTARVRARIFVGGPALDQAGDSSDIPGVRLPTVIGDAANVMIDALTGSRSERKLTDSAPISLHQAHREVD